MALKKYHNAVINLKPTGKAWSENAFDDYLANYFFNTDEGLYNSIDTVYPKTADGELLTRLNTIFGRKGINDLKLPLQELKRHLVASFFEKKTLSKKDFIKTFELFGFKNIEVEELQPFQVNTAVNKPLCGLTLSCCFIVYIEKKDIVKSFTVMTAVNQRLSEPINKSFIKLIKSIKPVHTGFFLKQKED